jgi:O-antigen ligase
MVGPGRTSPRYTFSDIDRLFVEQRGRDALGVRIHEWCAYVACFLAGWPTMVVEWATLPVLLACAIRLTGHRRVPGPLLWDVRVRLLFGLWTAGTRREWTGDIQTLRFAWLVLFLYPVMDRRREMITALVLGLACGQVVQGLDVIGHGLGVSWLDFKRAAGRHSGWWDPAVGGSVLSAALGLHVGALATTWAERGRTRWLALAGVAATLACIVLSGTRGAWIAAAGVLGAGVLLAAWRSPRRGRVLMLGGIGAAVAIASAGALVGSGALGVRERVDAGVREVRGALERGDYSSDTGMRIAMASWALREIAARPVHGVGAGGYRAWADGKIAEASGEKAGTVLPRPHAHAHNWYLHSLATLGLVGAGMLLAMVGLSVKSGLVWRGVAERGYDAGPAMGLVGLMLVGMFDTIHVNQQTAYVLYVLVAMCVACRPRLVGGAPLAYARGSFGGAA